LDAAAAEGLAVAHAVGVGELAIQHAAQQGRRGANGWGPDVSKCTGREVLGASQQQTATTRADRPLLARRVALLPVKARAVLPPAHDM
jgi:hypothetical protein